jgi:hypothetical protein
MSERSEDKRDGPEWIGLLIAAAAVMLCIGIGWTSLLILQFPSIRAIGGLVLAGCMGYGLFSGLTRLSNRYLIPAALGTLATITIIVILWPVACITQAGKFGSPIKHQCRCEGLMVTTFEGMYDPSRTSYCIGLETGDMWEEKIVIDMN